jgi:hypothetical protein
MTSPSAPTPLTPTPLTPTPLTSSPGPLTVRSAEEVLTAYDIAYDAMRTRVQDYYDESLNLKDIPGATYWNAYLSGMHQAKDFLDRLRRGEL